MPYVEFAVTDGPELLTVHVYQVQSGQWSWRASDDEGLPVAGGGGYDTREDAEDGARDALQVLS